MNRVERVTQSIKEEIGNIIHDELKDPRLGFVTVTGVKLSKDLRYAKVFFSVLGTEEERNNTGLALKSSLGFIRKRIAQRITLRFVPEIVLEEDKSAQYSMRIQQVLNEIKEREVESRKNRKNYRKK